MATTKRKIPFTIVPYAYEIAKKVYAGHIAYSDGVKAIIGENLINKNSAPDYINNFKCLIEGKKFSRTLNAYSMEYFLRSIYKDFGGEKLLLSLKALDAHIKYYESIHAGNTVMHKMRAIHRKFSYLFDIQRLDHEEQNDVLKSLIAEKKSKTDLLKELLQITESDSEITTYSGKAYKRDNITIAKIKLLRGFKCQFCQQTIKKKDGTFYIEAAHIKAKKHKGCERLNNIILLCPNHHKEFDLGDRKIEIHTESEFVVTVNDEKYQITFESAG